MSESNFQNNIAIATGTGRCGTQFLFRLIKKSVDWDAYHDPDPMLLSFYRYCNWNRIKVDKAGWVDGIKKVGVYGNNRNSLISSAHLAFSIEDFIRYFNGKVIILYRSPEQVVNSYFKKGLYIHQYVYEDVTLPIGYQNVGAPHHFFGRTVPNSAYYDEWNQLTRIGKLAWMWNAINKEIFDQLGNVNNDKIFTTKIEELDFRKYQELCDFLQLTQPVSKQEFNELVAEKPNSNIKCVEKPRSIHKWSDREIQEFEQLVLPMACELGYEYRINELRKNTTIDIEKKQGVTPTHLSFQPKNWFYKLFPFK